jgi:hypothetical protein
MTSRKFDGRGLRQLAGEIVKELAEADEVFDSQRADYETSLVRQWITYEGCAALILGDRPVYFRLHSTPLGRMTCHAEPGRPGALQAFAEDWKLTTEQLPEIRDQLNRGQSAEAVNGEGQAVRLWLNPLEASLGAEAAGDAPPPADAARDYQKIALGSIRQHFGEAVDPDELDALACSVARQWRLYDGHATIFASPSEQHHLQITEKSDGGCVVGINAQVANLTPIFDAHGIPPQEFSEIIARINLCQKVEFQDARHGGRAHLWHDPRVGRIFVRLVGPDEQMPTTSAPPIFCPQCSAVLLPWEVDQRRQNCPQCGGEVTFS